MSQLLLKGGRHLDGEVQIQGAKNSVLPILAATLLTGDAVELKNCPRLKDVDASVPSAPWGTCSGSSPAPGLPGAFPYDFSRSSLLISSSR